MNKWLFDTSVYIPLFREGRFPLDPLQDSKRFLYLSSVVAQELYAGALTPFSKKALDRFVSAFHSVDRVLTPTSEDWVTCGKILSRIGEEYGFESVKKGRLVNDVLIALSCRKVGAVLVSSNATDFKIITEFLDFSWRAPGF